MQKQEQVAIGLRTPPDLATWLKQEAKRNMRSVNAEVNWLLEQVRSHGITVKQPQGGQQ